MCDTIAIVNHGEIIRCAPTKEILSDADSKNITLILSKEYIDKSSIKKIGGVVDKDGNISISYNPKQETSRDILSKAEAAGLEVNDFSVTGASLETVFLSMTSKK